MSKKIDVFKEPKLDKVELTALQKLSEGEANGEDQKLALQVIIGKLCLYDVLAYQAGSFDETAFLNGRVFVGKLLYKQLRINVGDQSQ